MLREKCFLQFEILRVKTWHGTCVKENNNGGRKQAYKRACEFYKNFSWCNFLLHGRDFTKSYQCFPWWRLSLIHGNQHSQHLKKYKKTETPKQDGTQDGKQQKIQGSNRSKDREMELLNKEVWRKRKGKVFNTRIWLIHNSKVT